MEEREMNLYDFCGACVRWIGRGLKACWNAFAAMLRLTFRQWWVVLIVIVLALVVANYYARRANRIYKVEAIVWLNGPSLEQTEQAFMNLSHALPSVLSEKQTLTTQLGLTEHQLRGVHKLQTFHVIDCLNDSVADYVDYRNKASRTDTVNVHMPNRLCVSFRTTNLSAVDTVGEAIIAFLNRQPQMQVAFEKKRALLEREAQFAQSHIEKLDSLTTAFYFEQGIGQQIQANRWESGFVAGKREIKFFTPVVYSEFANLEKINQLLGFCTAPVVVEDNFKINPNAVNGRIKMNIIGLIVGWLLGCLIAALIEQRKALISWLKQ
ncbi:MAG: hypothetical protein J5612_03270 [Paludibacteraceae bacterium]|nr:hypothetical protein [Paludibacteraceae bacterium]